MIQFPYLKMFYHYFDRLPTEEEHLEFIKLFVMAEAADYQIIRELKKWDEIK